MKQLSHRHHYVPIWYQKRFLAPGQTAFKILDLKPEVYRDATGKVLGTARNILTRGPDKHFWEHDLYSIRWLGRTDDVIERQLFGTIDTMGKRALEAWLAEDWETVHETYWHVYEFLDALRLRTPKGLRFVESLTRAKGQQAKMVAMQELRRMHCIMWAEGALEIVRAPEGSAGFIFSDHPVTFFNRHVFPGDPKIPPGHDPALHWQGTQTLFPFDRERLYILTHMEYAAKPGPLKARKPRTNSRYFDPGTPMVRYDDSIRSRTLTEQQVYEANYIIKARADRYIAGRTEADLFPERHLKTTTWSKLGEFLMPKDRWKIHPEAQTTIQYEDGTFAFQDAFGRRPQSKAEYDKKVEEAKKMRADFERIMAKSRAENAAKAAAEAEKPPEGGP